MLHYISTRGENIEKRGAEAIIAGIASDKGLYVPSEIPKLPFDIEDIIKKTDSLSYNEIAEQVIGAFFQDYTNDEIQNCVDSAYDEKFDAPDIVPLVKTKEAYFLELYHGRTSAFKDMALSILPYLLTTAMKKENEKSRIVILTATSGDTGKAALEGFADVPGTEIIVFYPNKGVSKVQELQMSTQEGKNTHVYAIQGNFDDAQTGVKEIFNDKLFNEELAKNKDKLSSANSINIGRLVPQVAYYAYAYIKLVKDGEIKLGEKINVVVPTGNFGNILAAYYAKEMGLPINKFICASNVNKVLTDFINTGVYDINRDFHLTNSPSMDILISSNLERLLFHLSGNDSDLVADLMNKLDTKKRYEVNDTIRENMSDFVGGFADVDQTNDTIGRLYKEQGYLVDTHTAVAYKVYEDYKKETGDKTATVIASTASAYKFAESVAKSIGLDQSEDELAYLEAIAKKTGVKIPKGLNNLDEKKVLHDEVIEIDEMKDAVKKALVR